MKIMNIHAFPLMRMRPSEREWMLANFEHAHVSGQYFEELMAQLLRTYRVTSLIDDIWVGGIENRLVFALLDAQHRMTIENLDTDAARVFMNGINGRDWNEGIDHL
jgi:hypothetical protein